MRLMSKMFSLQGRDTRGDFLAYIGLSILLVLVGTLVIAGVSSVAAPGSMEPGASPPVFAGLLIVALVLVVFVVRILSTARRFRDIGASPWLTLLMLVPLINFITMVALMFVPGKPGPSPEETARVF